MRAGLAVSGRLVVVAAASAAAAAALAEMDAPGNETDDVISPGSSA